jgi:hypothetical protein
VLTRQSGRDIERLAQLIAKLLSEHEIRAMRKVLFGAPSFGSRQLIMPKIGLGGRLSFLVVDALAAIRDQTNK